MLFKLPTGIWVEAESVQRIYTSYDAVMVQLKDVAGPIGIPISIFGPNPDLPAEAEKLALTVNDMLFLANQKPPRPAV